MKFMHVSDLHYHRDRRSNKDANKLLKSIHKKYPDHILIVTGDITDDGDRIQYGNAFSALAPFKGRLFIAPGNHDFGAAGLFYGRERAILFDEMLMNPLGQDGTFTGDNNPVVSIVDNGDVSIMLIALDTNLETSHPFDFACGEVGRDQLAALDTILSDPSTAGLVKMVFFHHHPFMHGNPFMELCDARALMRTMFRRVDVVLFGHKHVSKKWENLNGIPFVLASDNSPGKDWIREIVIERDMIAVNDIPT